MKERPKSKILLAIPAVLLCLARPAPSAVLLISEFLAVNDGLVADEDGEFPDWIEIYNPGLSSVSLLGWSLTDDPTQLGKWKLPAVVLPSRGFLVVFASGKHRIDPAGELHTNFKLSSQGEFLALVDPEGAVASSFSPAYPKQFRNISCGFSEGIASSYLVPEGSPLSALVPSSSALGDTWTGVSFDDAAWIQGISGAGFDTGADYTGLIRTNLLGAMRGVNASAYLRFPFDVANPASLDSLLLRVKYDDGFVAYLNGTEVARRNAPAALAWNSAATADHGEPVLGSMGQDFDVPGTAYVLTAHGTAVAPEVKSGGPAGNYLQLMPDMTGNLSNTIGFARTFGAVDSAVIEFDYRMSTETGYTGNERAHGFGVALASTAAYGTSGAGPYDAAVGWERPRFAGVFSVGFDIYDGSRTENTVTVNWNGLEVGAVKVSEFPLNGGNFNHVKIEVTKEGNDSRVSVTVTPDSLGTPGTPALPFVGLRVAGMSLFENRLAFGGRTGGEYVGLDLDNIKVQYVRGTPQISYEDIDISEALPRLVAGRNLLAIQGLNRSSGGDDFLILPELSAFDQGALDPQGFVYFPQPTPGTRNGLGYSEVVSQPTLSHSSGCYPSTFSLAISESTPGSALRYTLDGSEPTGASAEYTAPISISATRVVKAKAFKTGSLESPTSTRFFVRLNANVTSFTSNLPLAIVETFGGGINDVAYTPAWSMFLEGAGGRTALTTMPDHTGRAGIKWRGSSSLGFPKKMYAFETLDDFGDDLDVPLLGLPPDSDWVLNGPYSDKSLMRNVLAYGWCNDIGTYAPRTRFFELYLSTHGSSIGNADYLGVYVLIEKIRRSPDRVDIKELLPSDEAEPEITGGYILKKDRLDPGDVGFQTARGTLLGYVDPKEQEITPAQKVWIKGYLDAFESALFGASFADPVNGYRKYIDLDAFIDHHILVEVTRNIDGYGLSTFMYKDRGSKLCMGPIWDYNLSLGNADYADGWLTAGWNYTRHGGGGVGGWYGRLFQDPDFVQRYVDRWTSVRRAALATDTLLQRIDDIALLLDESQKRNFVKWPVLGVDVWPNWYVAKTYAEEIAWMKGWVVDRSEWIDGNWLPAPQPSQNGGAIPAGGFDLVLSAPSGMIYYTLDGSDPRLPGGGAAPEAIAYGGTGEVQLVRSGAGGTVKALVPTGSLGGTWTGVGYNDSSWRSTTAGSGVGFERGTGYESLINIDVGTDMYSKNASVYIRAPFQVEDPSAYSSLTLRVMYDDGFAAYLNGQMVASSNVPSPLEWNSVATGLHDDAAAVVFENYNITTSLGLLRSGANVLAIQGLNQSATSSDMLIRFELLAASSFTGDAIRISGPTRVVARATSAGAWSGPTDVVFVPDVPVLLRVTEIMYHPRPAESGSPYNAEDFEFLEVENVGASPASLLGVRLTAGVVFDFTLGQVAELAPGERAVVVENLEAFASRYDTSQIKVAGQYTGKLENAGELIRLEDGRGTLIQEFFYLESWYPQTDGGGPSLHIVDSRLPVSNWGLASSWTASSEIDGSPGAAEPSGPGGWQLPGDINQDSVLDVSDAIKLLLYLFSGGTRTLPCGDSLTDPGNAALVDFNGSEFVDITDAIQILGYLFRQGSPPALGPRCQRIAGCPSVCTP